MNPPKLKSGLLAVCFMLVSLTITAAETTGEVWIDVRTTEEHQESPIPGHENILYTEIGEKISAVSADKNAPVYLYCGSGRRAGIAKETLEKMGYTNVTNAGGIEQVKDQLATE